MCSLVLASRPCHLRFRSPRNLCPRFSTTSVPGPKGLRPRSVGFVSPVGWVCVPGRLGLCPWSEGFVSPVRSFVGDRGRQNAQNAENRRRSRVKMRTGDGMLLDLGRKTPGPATESALTCDGRTAGRKQARKQARRQARTAGRKQARNPPGMGKKSRKWVGCW